MMGSKTRIAAAVLVFGWLLTAVFAQQEAPPAPRVIVIGVDGLSVDGIGKAQTPHLHELMSRGAWTLEARGVMPTLSSPNWASVINGAGPEQHGITSNGHLRHLVEFQPSCRDAEGVFPTIFGILREQHPQSRIAVFHDWRGFADLLERQAPNVLEHESGAAKTMEAAIRYWRENHPSLMFVHLDNVDHAGHDDGWLSRPYYHAVEAADGYIGQVMDMLARQPAGNTTFLLITSDHGGTRRGHGRNSLAEIQIPWILTGPGVVPGRIMAPVNTFDTAATLAWIFDLEPPACWIGRPVRTAFQPSVTLAHGDACGPPQHRFDTVLAGR